MKKKVILLLCGLSICGALGGCGKKKDPTETVAERGNDFTIAESSEEDRVSMNLQEAPGIGKAELIDYQNLEVTLDHPKVEEIPMPELEGYMQQKLMENPDPVTDRGIKANDLVTVDFNGTIDGEPFTGGSAIDATFQIGNGQMLEDFERALYDAKTGEDRTAIVAFPEEYSPEVGGKTATFIIKIKKVETPAELTDAFVQKHSKTGAETVEAYREELRSEYLDILRHQDILEAIQRGLRQIAAESTLEPSEEFTAYVHDYFTNMYGSWIAESGMSREDYLSEFNMTEEDLEDRIEEMTTDNTPHFMVLKKIFEDQKLDVTDELITSYFQRYYGAKETLDSLKKQYGPEYEMITLQVAVFTYMEDHITVLYDETATDEFTEPIEEETVMETEPESEPSTEASAEETESVEPPHIEETNEDGSYKEDPAMMTLPEKEDIEE